jgi:hypothetical protein
MYIGTLYIRLGGIDYPTPPFPRGGLAATFGAEVFALDGTSPGLDIEVQHKNEEDLSFIPAGNFSTITTPGVYTLDVGPLKENVRLKVNVTGASNLNTVYANILAPMWRPY